MANRVYDDHRKESRSSSISDEELRQIMGVTSDEEAAMERMATHGAASDILSRERKAAAQANKFLATGGVQKDKVGSGWGATSQEIRGAEENPMNYTGGKESEPTGFRDKLRNKGIKGLVKKKSVIITLLTGGGIGGGLGFLSMSIPPLQFINLSKMLTGTDFSAGEDEGDTSLLRLMRYSYNIKKGQPERTRLSEVGNKMADKIEKSLNKAGLKSAYTNIYGYLDGYVIDKESPKYSGMTDEQIKQEVEKRYGVTVKNGSAFPNNTIPAGDLVIDVRSMGYSEQKKLVSGIVTDMGHRKSTGAIAGRLAAKRGGTRSKVFHPIEAIDKAYERKIETIIHQHFRRQIETLKSKPPSINTTVTPNEDANPEEKANADANKAAADAEIADGQKANTDLAGGDTEAIAKYQQRLMARIATAGAAGGALGLPCILNGIAERAAEIKRDQVIFPLKNMALQTIGLGNQAMSGVDITAAQVQPFSEELEGKDAKGKVTSVYDSDIMRQKYTGDPARGNPPDKTVTTVGEGSPFDFLKSEPYKSPLAVVCSAAFQNTALVLSFITGPAQTVVGAIASHFIVNNLIEESAQWISGNAVDIFAKGAKRGDFLATGSFLAANDAELARGASPLPDDEAIKLHNEIKYSQMEEFRSKSIAYRLFNPTDYRTPMARLMRSQIGNDQLAMAGSLFGNILHMGDSFGSTLLGAVSGKSYAATSYYSYKGVPKVAHSLADMNNPDYSDPYALGDRVADILDSSAGQGFIDRAKKCKGVTIKKEDNKWIAISEAESTPFLSDSTLPECSEQTKEWKMIGFFIGYTQDINAFACTQGDEKACVESGFKSAAAPSAQNPGLTDPVTGTAKELAQKILDEGNVTWQLPDQETAFRQIAKTGTQSGCGDVEINPDLLAVILRVSRTYKLVIGTMVYGHVCDGGYHPKGMAVDVNGFAKDGVTTGRMLTIPYQGSAEQNALMKAGYEAFANAMPANTGGMGQILCAWQGGPPARKQGVAYFDDTCEHIHVDVRKN